MLKPWRTQIRYVYMHLVKLTFGRIANFSSDLFIQTYIRYVLS